MIINVLLSLVVSAQAQILKPLPITPAERYVFGDHSGGIELITNKSKCPPAGASLDVRKIPAPLQFISQINPKNPSVANLYNLEIQRTLSRTLDKLALHNLGIKDPAATHPVCVGLYNYGEFNAQSYSTGYILVDPSVVHEMYTFPGRSMLSIDQVYLHEFAHQLQYWNGNEFENDKTARRTELAADCIGSALLAITWSGLDAEILKMEGLGMIHSAELVGDDDVNNPDHHGTSKERKRAVEAGLDYVNRTRKTIGLKPWSTRIIEACNAAIR